MAVQMRPARQSAFVHHPRAALFLRAGPTSPARADEVIE